MNNPNNQEVQARLARHRAVYHKQRQQRQGMHMIKSHTRLGGIHGILQRRNKQDSLRRGEKQEEQDRKELDRISPHEVWIKLSKGYQTHRGACYVSNELLAEGKGG